MKKMKYLFCLALGAILMASCSDASEEMTSVNYARNFAPVGLEAKVRNNTNVELSWTVMAEAAHYIVEVYEDDELEFAGTPIQTLTVLPEEVPYTVTGLLGETWYSFRVKSVDANAAKESKWSTASVETGKEQIFKTVADEDIKAKQVTLRWPAGEAAATITLTPGNIEYTITDADIAAGAATITGLTPETEYTAVMKRSNGLTRGTISFTTPIELAETDLLVEEGADLAAKITEAYEKGKTRLIVMPGTYTAAAAEGATYTVGSFAITKDITIKGLRENDKPIIKARFELKEGASLDLEQVIVDAKGGSGDQMFVFTDAVAYDHLNIVNSEIMNTTKGFYYIAVSGQSVGSVTINNTIVHDIECDGGDLFDGRSGDLTTLTITNSTFYNCALSRDVVRDNKKCGTVVTIDHCTFANVLSKEGATNRFFNIQSGTNKGSITFTNNIVFNMQGATNHSKTPTPSFENNVYYNSAKFEAWDKAGLVTDPKFKDAANGDFTIGEEKVNDAKAGDPRWLVTL